VIRGELLPDFSVSFSKHALEMMSERHIRRAEVLQAVRLGEVIKEYPDDRPLPSRLILGGRPERPIHVVAGVDEREGKWYIITVYEPDRALWSADLRERKTQ
jgi:hypothetical protein